MSDTAFPLHCQTEVDIGDLADFSAPPAGEPECQRHPIPKAEFSSKSGHGGPRANSGGPRPNSGGARPNSGPKPKPKLIVPPKYATDELLWRVVSFWGQAEVSGTTELTRLGYDAYMPLVAIRRRDPVVKTMFHTVRVPFLPGYGFIRLTTTQSREPILAVRGVREVLRRPDGRPSSVSDAEIERMQAWDERRLQLPKEHGSVLAADARVRIEDGAFGDRFGTVIRCDGVKTQVEIDFFGRPMPIWLDRVSVSEIV